LVGLACKNAILIVEFAKQRQEAGADRRTAALEACELRLRPIVMTSVAFIIGVVPLVLAEGAGAEMRHALGTAVFAGMVGVTAFGIFLTPAFFLTVQRLKDWWSNGKPPRPPEPRPAGTNPADDLVKVALAAARVAAGGSH
jgi:multidrug efflux pump